MVTLRYMVIAGYNVGIYGLINTDGTQAEAPASIQDYLSDVTGLLTSCVCKVPPS